MSLSISLNENRDHEAFLLKKASGANIHQPANIYSIMLFSDNPITGKNVTLRGSYHGKNRDGRSSKDIAKSTFNTYSLHSSSI